MSRWTEQFKNHAIHVEFAELGTMVQEISTDDPGASEEVVRLRKVHAFVAAFLEAVDPEIIAPSLLGNMHSYVRNAINEINAYRSAPNVGYLQQANTHYDSLLGFVASTPFTPANVDGALAKASAAHANAVAQLTERFRDSLAQQAAQMLVTYTSINQSAETVRENTAKLEARVSAMEAQLPNLLATFTSTFQQSENQRSSTFDNWTSNYQSKLDDQFLAAAQKFHTGESTMDSQLERAEKVLGSVIDTAQAGAYATYANEEKRSANSYRRLAISLMAAAGLVLFLPELLHAARAASEYAIGYQLDWKAALYRLPFSAVLFAPALYLARESSRHRTNEVLNRRRQHILTTIGPYLALLEPKRAEEIKTDVAKSIFRDNPMPAEDRSLETSNLLGQLTNLVSAILKGGNRS